MNYADFIATAWNDHAEDADAVARRLAEPQAQPPTTSDMVPFARLVTHVYGEHLARWQAGVDLLAALRTQPSWEEGGDAAAAVARGIAVLRYAGGSDTTLAGLGRDDAVMVLATAASALGEQRQFARAGAAYDEALTRAAATPSLSVAAARALAIAGNGLATTLEQKPARSAAETATMLAAARGGLDYWRIAGGWLEEERALYRLARSLLQAGDPVAAGENARRCVAVCEAHAAPAFETYFGHAVVAIAARAAGDLDGYAVARARALACYAQVPAAERPWCAQEQGELGAAGD
jgi:hypothetical protein